MSSIDVADFFCGCGGTSAGLRAAGMQIRLGLDMEADAAATYRANFEDADFIEQDLREVDPLELSERLIRTPGSRLLVSACAPCQPYTNFHRKSARPAEQRTLLLALLPLIDHLYPEFVFVENVPGLHRSRARAPSTASSPLCVDGDSMSNGKLSTASTTECLSAGGGSCCWGAVLGRSQCRPRPTAETAGCCR
jgi:site-specific DNA-cytosine methylase